MLLTILDTVYVNAKDQKCIVAVKVEPVLRPILQVATIKEGSGIELLTNGPPECSQEARRCFWWRRGRVERYRKHGLSFCSFGEAGLKDGSSVMSAPGLRLPLSPLLV